MNPFTFAQRRHLLRQQVAGGAIVLFANGPAPRNYPRNTYPFRQDSHFLYYTGIDAADVALIVFQGGEAVLYGDAPSADSLIWSGPGPEPADLARAAGIERVEPASALEGALARLQAAGEPIRWLPPVRAERTLWLCRLLGMSPAQVSEQADRALARAVVEQRARKSDEEVAQIEAAISVSKDMYDAALAVMGPGATEAAVRSAMEAVALARNLSSAFAPIVTVRGEILHNERCENTLAQGDLLLIDTGVEMPPFAYCSDITRTFPVGGAFDARQKMVYAAVLRAQELAIAAASPEVSNRDVHRIACRALVDGLQAMGLMKGDPDEAVQQGAHALFFPHGIGHMLGIDVHDMEDLGDAVGYPEDEGRSGQFGLSYLRLAKALQPGFVITVEPGLYFIPALVGMWRAKRRHDSFINYDEAEKFLGKGGVRIEDDILITADGCRVLGPPILKSIDDIEQRMKQTRGD